MIAQWLIQASELGVLALALLLLIPIGVVFVECMAALLPHRQPASQLPNSEAAVLIPAHNEEAGLAETLTSVLSSWLDSASVCVVADNCTDRTAAIAKDFGVTVLERYDQTQRGKGYALDFGLCHIANEPPQTVVMVDADCTVDGLALTQIAHQSLMAHRPVQAVYLMERPPTPSPSDSISALAFLVKNWVRPSGLARLGLPCLLTGTGMAFPWPVIRNAPLASSNIVEDMQLGLDLAIAGHPPQFCPTARVTGRLPQDEDAAKGQRTRWEHGHLETLTTQVPRLVKQALIQRRFDLLALALELAVPPLSLLVMAWGAALVLAGLVAFVGSAAPLYLLGAEGLLILIAIIAAWAKFGRGYVSGAALLAAPLYVAWKIPLYLAFIVNRQTDWVRTKRDVT
ncbi:MAG: glycosyltransferase family 2 protein [Elainellaceae cyanobacterium]